MKLVGLILAKGQSKRLPGKNKKDFKGEPMFLINVKKCRRVFGEVYVSSDDEEILNLARSAGAITIRRGEELGGETPDIPVYQHAVNCMPDIDGIVAVHANNPTIDINTIIAVKKILETGVPEVMTCHTVTDANNYHNQSAKIYGSVRGMTVERLYNYGDPYKPRPEVMVVDTSIEIETIEDYNKALCQ